MTVPEPVVQHRAEATCWCKPMRESNGAYTHHKPGEQR